MSRSDKLVDKVHLCDATVLEVLQYPISSDGRETTLNVCGAEHSRENHLQHRSGIATHMGKYYVVLPVQAKEGDGSDLYS